jgi:murein DD-endopeptidase MepM/ murein hydrolase activator NlpD
MLTLFALISGSLGLPLTSSSEEPTTSPAVHLEPQGGGEFDGPVGECLSDAERRIIWRRIHANERMIELLELVSGSSSKAAGPAKRHPASLPVEFAWPINAVGSAALDYGVHGISNFVDADKLAGAKLDHNCGGRTYDQHHGVDIFSWPYAWNRVESNEIEIVAAAPGVIVLRQDGFFDKSCGPSGLPWNAVYVRNVDGSLTWYGHLKKGSLTTKTVGKHVETGEYLGVMGSSGNSTGPHLHLEVYNAKGKLVDPFEGPCQAHAALPTWEQQPPYFDSAINRIQVGRNAPVLNPCPELDVPNASGIVFRNGYGYFTTFYRDQRGGQISAYRIIRPNGTIFQQWTHGLGGGYISASWWYWWFWFPAGAPTGTWRFEVDYESKQYSMTFTVS